MDGWDDFVGSDRFNNNDFLELVKVQVIRLREVNLLWLRTVKQHFPLIWMFHEVVLNAFHDIELASAVELSVEVWPLVFRYPGGWVFRNMNLARWSRQEIPPFFGVNPAIPLLNFDGQDEREEKFVFLEKRPTHIFVKGVSEMAVHVLKSFFEDV